jgi:hypothetical protein
MPLTATLVSGIFTSTTHYMKHQFTGFIQSYTDDQLDGMVQKLQDIITNTFKSSKRTDKLLAMYAEMYSRLVSAPASAKVQYHNAFPGGYLDHVLRVITNLDLVERLFKHTGGVLDYTREEGIFAAMHHDLYKLGDEHGPNYIPETDNYWVKKGSVYDYNNEIPVMTGTDRTFYLLQKHGVTYSQNEMLGIRCADGIYDDANKKYFMANGTFPLVPNIIYMVHWADHMAAVYEKQQAKTLLGY